MDAHAEAATAAHCEPRATLFEVELDARWRIWALFGLLVLVTWVCLVPLGLLLALLLHLEQRGTGLSVAYWAFPGVESVTVAQVASEFALITAALGLAIALVAWLVSRVNARPRLLRAMRAGPPDSHDDYHRRFSNIVDELRIAAGLPALDAVVLRALTVSAVAFADSRGPACVGVTEGALSRLSRPQLQAVVAHEVAHVASRDCEVATRACLLFMGVRRIADTYGRAVTVAIVVGYVGICLAALMPLQPLQVGMFWVVVALSVWTAAWLSFWAAAVGGSVVDLALSRQREFAADAAAVRFTGDPASLAEALLVIEWQRGAAPAVPASLAPLAIAPSGLESDRAPWRWFGAHPPLGERIARLQTLATGRGQSLWERRADVERRVKAREHAVPARARTGGEPAMAPPVDAADVATCPRCGAALRELSYEGSAIIECPACGGVGATGPQVEAILARRDWGFTPDQVRMGEMIERRQKIARPVDASAPAAKLPPVTLPWAAADAEPSDCPLCRAPMRRAPWSLAYPLPTDHCGACDLHWFDRDEIEVLQVLVERQNR